MKRQQVIAAILVLCTGLMLGNTGCDEKTNTDTGAMANRPPATVRAAQDCPGPIVNGMCDYSSLRK